MNFKDWLCVENTISQTIKNKYKETYKKLYQSVNKLIKNSINLSDESYEILTKWYIFNYIEYLKENDMIESQSTYRMFFYPNGEVITSGHSDYLSAREMDGDFENKLKSKFNDPYFSINDLEKAIERWHSSMESKTRLPGAEGKVILDLSSPIEPKNISLLGSGWDGWKWVDINKGYCDKESKSMGHCGNSGAKDGDTILSLRDENNIPHLTFILNNGKLGEMKGRNNNKPSEKYHPAIIELLKLPIISQVVGGGYKPENNFSLNDLDDEIKEELLEFKPDLEFDVVKDISEKMEETRERLDVKNWNFAWEQSEIDMTDNIAYISMYGGFSTILKIKLIKDLPNWYTGNIQDWRDIKKSIKDGLKNLFSIEDIEIEEQKNGILIKGSIYHESYGEELDNFESFIHHLAQDVEPYEEEFKGLVQRVLAQKGYIAPYYVSRVDKDQGKIFWSQQKFKNFNWEVSKPLSVPPAGRFDYLHEISVRIFNNLYLGMIENNNKNYYTIPKNNNEIKNLEKDLENELIKISFEAWNKESKQGLLFQTQKEPYFLSDMKIKPQLIIRIISNRQNYNSEWNPEKNPVTDFKFYLDGYVEISQVNTNEEAKKAERMLHFIDNNYETIKQRLVKVFNNNLNNFKKLTEGNTFKEILNEMPIKGFNLIGQWGKDAKRKYGYSAQDTGILENPRAVEKIHKNWSNSKYDFDFYFVRSYKASKHRAVGQVNLDWLKNNLEIEITPKDDHITVIFTNNMGDEKIPATAWALAHRLGHAIGREKIFEDYFRKQVNKDFKEILNYVYGINVEDKSKFYSDTYYSDYEKHMKSIFLAVGKMKSARENILRNSNEFIYELVAQHIITGKIEFNDLPRNLIIQKTMAWGRPNYRTKNAIDIDMYNEYNANLHNNAEVYEHYLDNIFGSLLNKIFVM